MFATRLLCAGGRVIAPAAALLFALHAPLAEPAKAQDIPGYSVQFIGPGFPKAVNNDGKVVGWKIVDGKSRPWVSNGSGQLNLPFLPDMKNGRANAVNDAGEIVGANWTNALDEPGQAVIWIPDGSGGYDVFEIETLPGDRKSEAKAINNDGDIVGTRIKANGSPGDFIRLAGFDAQPLNLGAQPEDINNLGDVIGGGRRLDADGTMTIFGQPPEFDDLRYNFAYFYALNDAKQSAGRVQIATSNNEDQRAVLYNNGVKTPLWDYISQVGVFDAAYGINEGGDVVFEVGFLCEFNAEPMVYLDDGDGGATRHCLQDLIVTPGWFLQSANFDADINDSRQIVTVARNNSFGQSGAVLLTPGQLIDPPEQPQNLAAATHEAGAGENWNGIQVTWDDTGNESSYSLERRPTGTGGWTEIATPTMNVTSYDDKLGATGETFDYRVSAVNAVGASAPSNVGTAKAPDTGKDNKSPSIQITAPSNGATVSGSVKVTMEASDNVGVAGVDLKTSTNLLICNVPSPTDTKITCNWNARKVAAGLYTLTAKAWDAAGNYSEDSISVTVEKKKGGGPKNP